MGSKSAAKSLMEGAGVPLVPGYHGADQDPVLLAREADRIGFPVLIKASAGGGGKGMRIVESPAAFAEGLALAQGEARASFGDDHVLVERYLQRPRHIEVQVFADRHGNVVHLFERDCSIQRRHQKVVEEAPAPGMTAERRAAMGRAACDAARAIGYEGAGTVEFIAENDAFFFMEMNTRLQVEHPVTEMITGQDLVEWQLRVANGEPLPLQQHQLAIHGHAMEVRLYAEDPARDYMPGTGTLHHLRAPEQDAHTRIDTGVQPGDAVTVHYDPMIAKLIVWDETRPAAVRRLQSALDRYEVAGVQTNLELLRRIAHHPAFAAAELDTGFLGRHPDLLAPPAATPPDAVLAAAAAALLDAPPPRSPWDLATAWRLNGTGHQDILLRHAGVDHLLRAFPTPGGTFALDLDGRRLQVERRGGALFLDGVRHQVSLTRNGAELLAVLDGTAWMVEHPDPLAAPEAQGLGGDRLLAPMPGRVVSVAAAPGDQVTRGTVLVVLEAMKVQMRLTAPRDGLVERVQARPGELVEDGAELVRFGALP